MATKQRAIELSKEQIEAEEFKARHRRLPFSLVLVVVDGKVTKLLSKNFKFVGRLVKISSFASILCGII
jgi:hypothetical protein